MTSFSSASEALKILLISSCRFTSKVLRSEVISASSVTKLSVRVWTKLSVATPSLLSPFFKKSDKLVKCWSMAELLPSLFLYCCNSSITLVRSKLTFSSPNSWDKLLIRCTIVVGTITLSGSADRVSKSSASLSNNKLICLLTLPLSL